MARLSNCEFPEPGAYMMTLRETATSLEAGALAEHYLVSHGKSGGLGSFVAHEPLGLARGDRVVIDSPRGREIGTILCLAGVRQSRLLGAVSSGTIVRPLNSADEIVLDQARVLEHRLFEASRQLAQSQNLPLEILDVDVFIEGRAVLQFVGAELAELDAFAQALSASFQLDIRLENLALPEEPADLEAHGCGKPDCGKAEGGGCSTCSTGGGCSSCGTGATDLRPYVSHLRTQMEAANRTPLL